MKIAKINSDTYINLEEVKAIHLEVLKEEANNEKDKYYWQFMVFNSRKENECDYLKSKLFEDKDEAIEWLENLIFNALQNKVIAYAF